METKAGIPHGFHCHDMNHNVIDTSRVVKYEDNKSFMDILLCIFCYSLSKHPLQCKGCESIACEECIAGWNKVDQCPLNCEDPCYKKPSRSVLRMLDELIISCKNKKYGCEEELKYPNLANHESECPYNLVKCKAYEECKSEMPRKDIEKHENTCGFIKVTCHLCENSYYRVELGIHIKSCADKDVECINCNEKIKNDSISMHIETCPEKKEDCARCGQRMKKKDKEQHDCLDHMFHIIKQLITDKVMLKEQIAEMKDKINKLENSFNGFTGLSHGLICYCGTCKGFKNAVFAKKMKWIGFAASYSTVLTCVSCGTSLKTKKIDEDSD